MTTFQDIATKNFTFVQVFGAATLTFVVPTPSRPEAMKLAKDYLKARNIEYREIHLYPRTYAKDAQKAISEGRCC